MPIDQRHDIRIERDFSVASSEALTERLYKSILGLLSVRIMLVCRTASFNYARDAV
jgi:hypothetical protein